MIYIRLAGGLGNQIFQLAAGILLAETTGDNRIFLDDSAMKNYQTKRKNELLNFFDFSKFPVKCEFKSSVFNIFRIAKILPLKLYSYPFVSDRNFMFSLKNSNKLTLFLDGYFQECLTQIDFEKEIVILKKALRNEKNKLYEEACVIHVRGGDFVKLGWNSVTPKDFYTKAIKHMDKVYNIKKYYIITDDQEYANTLMYQMNIKYEFIGSSIYDDFYLIGAFKYKILSSSTFALWASALGNNSICVIAPELWKPDVERKIYLPNEERL